MKALFILCSLLSSLFAGNVLQKVIDHAKPGSLIILPPGIYKGNIIIRKPLIIDGKNQKAIIEGSGKGTVISVKSSYVTLKNLTIRNSGSHHYKINSGVSLINVNHCNVLHCRFINDLFGINMEKANNCNVSYNYITSKPRAIGLRGDALKLWYSNHNILEHNYVTKSRDFVIWFSSGNQIKYNYGQYSRYSLHFMYDGKNIVEHNLYKHNMAGIFFMYSDDTVIKDNTIEDSMGTEGIGIGFQAASNFEVQDNTIIHCSRGLWLNRSAYNLGAHDHFYNNKLFYNNIGVKLLLRCKRNIFKGNIFKGNIEDVVNESATYSKFAKYNTWSGNYWDRYEGFGGDNGVGNTPYIDYLYANKIWISHPNTRFFYGSPVISLMDFIDKIAPLSQPVIVLVDKHPAMTEGDVHEY